MVILCDTADKSIEKLFKSCIAKLCFLWGQLMKFWFFLMKITSLSFFYWLSSTEQFIQKKISMLNAFIISCHYYKWEWSESKKTYSRLVMAETNTNRWLYGNSEPKNFTILHLWYLYLILSFEFKASNLCNFVVLKIVLDQD